MSNKVDFKAKYTTKDEGDINNDKRLSTPKRCDNFNLYTVNEEVRTTRKKRQIHTLRGRI